MRGPLSKCQSPAHFFKFIKPGSNSMSQLSIPLSFSKYIKSRSNETVILKRGSQKWSVKMIDWAFTDGWDGFTRDNGVQECDIVVFKHEGTLVFDTMVFDTSWCKREYSNNQVPESLALKKIPNEKDTIPDHNHHPYFIGSLRSDCRYNLYLPMNFKRSSGLRTRKMILRNGQSQMSWPVELKISSKGYSRITRGWLDFSTANGLKEGDHFKLELIQTGINPVAVFHKLSTKQAESHANKP